MEHLFHQWNVKLLPLSVNMWKARHTVIACGRHKGQVNHKVCLFLNMVDTSKRKDGKEKREAPIPIGSQ